MLNYTKIPDTECAKNEKFNFFVSEKDLLSDLKVIMADYYVAMFTVTGDALVLEFNNNQKFRITVKEV